MGNIPLMDHFSEKGARQINLIRFGLTVLFTTGMLSALQSLRTEQILFMSIGISIYAVNSTIVFLRLRAGKESYAFFFILMDSVSLYISTLGQAMVHIDVVAASLASSIQMIVSIFLIIYSGFLFSIRKTSIIGSIHFILHSLVLLIAYGQGIKFEERPDVHHHVYTVSFTIECVKLIFLLATTFCVGQIVHLLIGIKDAALDAKTKAESHSSEIEKQKNQMSTTAESLSSALSTMEEFIFDVNTQVQTQASSIEEISAALTEISQSTENSGSFVKEQYEKIEKLTKESSNLESIVKEVHSEIDEITLQINQSSEFSKEVAESIATLNKALNEVKGSFQKVEDVNQIMKEIADQTNLLALNASIEAARAGEHGRGFAVVAQEVAKLADNSASNANIISKTIHKSRSDLEAGTKSSVKASSLAENQKTRLSSIEGSVQLFNDKIKELQSLNARVIDSQKELKSLSSQLDTISQEQSQANKEVTSAAQSIEDAIQSVAENTENLKKQMEGISKLSESMR